MKDQIMLFIIGVLVGAVISTGSFFVYTTATNSNDCSNNTQMNGNQPPEMPSGQNNNGNQPPEKPGDNNTQDNNESNNS